VANGGALPGNIMTAIPIVIQGEAIREVQDFKYLGCTFVAFEDLEKELTSKFAQF